MNKKLKKILIISLFTACAIILSIIDKYISMFLFPSIPGAKIGLANVVILMCIVKLDFKESIIVALLKSLISGLLFSGLTSFVIGGSATLISFIVMYIVYKFLKNNLSLIGISMLGGFCHTFIQLVVIMLIYNMGLIVFTYGAYLFLISIITSIIMGLLAHLLIDKLKNAIDENI